MQTLIEKVQIYVEEHIGIFHNKRIEGLDKLNLAGVLKRKNPYMFKAKNINDSYVLVKSITDAFISSAEETLFGDWMEGLAIYINHQVYGGTKSGISGIDLEFTKDGIRYLVNNARSE